MSATLHRETLVSLRRQLAAPLAAGGVLPFGDARVDAHLPGGGLPLGRLHEIGGIGMQAQSGAVAGGFAALLAGALARAAGQGRALLWIAPSCDLYGPGLLQYGLDARRLILAGTDDDNQTLGAMETALRSGAATVVVGEVAGLTRLAARRLHLACLAGEATALLLRRWPHGRKHTSGGDSQIRDANAASTRWLLCPAPSAAARAAPGLPCWQVSLTHARGGRPGAWIMQCRPASFHIKDPLDAPLDPTGDAGSAHPVRVVAVLGNDAAAPRPDQIRRAG